MKNRDRLWIWGALCALGMQIGGHYAGAMVCVTFAMVLLGIAIMSEKETK